MDGRAISLTMTLKHLLNLLSMHRAEPEPSQLARLRLLLSENMTVADPRLLEAAFVCVSIIVRKCVDRCEAKAT